MGASSEAARHQMHQAEETRMCEVRERRDAADESARLRVQAMLR